MSDTSVPATGQWRLRFLVAHRVAEVDGGRWRAACEGRFPATASPPFKPGEDRPADGEDARCPRCDNPRSAR